jgi:hypothetical protein
MLLSRVKQATSKFVKILVYGKADIRTAQQYMPFGIDSKPPPETVALYSNTGSDGEQAIVGYLLKSELTNSGELRLSSLDSSGVENLYIHLKNNGRMEINGSDDNLVRYSVLKAGFDELKIDFNNFIDAYNKHTHGGVTVGSGITAITTPGSASAADISGAKIVEIETS